MDGRPGAPDDGGRPGAGGATDIVVDAANVIGSRPDGWWRDRPGAARRLLRQLSRLAAQRPGEVHAVLEGAARTASPGGLQDGVHVHLAPADGDAAVVALTERLVASAREVLVVTADRGLRARLPDAAGVAGPGWLRDVLDRTGQLGDAGGPGE